MSGHKIVNQNELHFLTMTVVGWIDVFSSCQQEKGLVISAYVIMCNHIHLICL